MRYIWRRVLARDLVQSCGLVQKEHHANGDHRIAAGESLRALRGIISSQPSNFRRNDVKRAVQALHGAVLKVGRVELQGKVPIIPAGDEEVADDSNNSFDKIMRKPGVV